MNLYQHLFFIIPILIGWVIIVLSFDRYSVLTFVLSAITTVCSALYLILSLLPVIIDFYKYLGAVV